MSIYKRGNKMKGSQRKEKSQLKQASHLDFTKTSQKTAKQQGSGSPRDSACAGAVSLRTVEVAQDGRQQQKGTIQPCSASVHDAFVSTELKMSWVLRELGAIFHSACWDGLCFKPFKGKLGKVTMGQAVCRAATEGASGSLWRV